MNRGGLLIEVGDGTRTVRSHSWSIAGIATYRCWHAKSVPLCVIVPV